MAICFVRASVIGRSSGRSATAAAAYRAGEKIMDVKTRKVHDYTRKQGVEYSEIISPIIATGKNSWMVDRSQLWNKVELGEKRVDAQVAREIIIAIPRELDRADQIALVREYVQSSYVDRGMIADINCHHLDSDNPHAHVMLTMRELQIDEYGTVGFGHKDRSWNKKELLAKQLHEWEVVANKYLEKAGVEARIDARSYEEQGIERIPQIHLGAAVSGLMKKGIESSVSIEYNRINLANTEIQSRLEEIYKLDLEITDRNEQIRINRNPVFLEPIDLEVIARINNEKLQRKPKPLTSEDLIKMIGGDDRAKRIVQWCSKNLAIPDGQAEVKRESNSLTAKMSAINVDSLSTAYVFTDTVRHDKLTINCCKSSGIILSMTGLVTGGIVGLIKKIDDLAIQEMLRSFRKTDKTEIVTPQPQVSTPEVDKTEIVTPQPQVSTPEVDKTEIVNIPEAEKIERPINQPSRRVISRRSHELG